MAAKKNSRNQDVNRKRVMQRLHDEHTYIGSLRRAMSVEVKQLKSRKQADLVILRDMIRYLMDYPDVHHHPLEDRVFEKLVQYDHAVRSDVLELLAEHKDMAREAQYLFHKLDAIVHHKEKLQKNLLYLSLTDFLQLYGEHVRREETIVFPAAEKYLTAAEWREIAEHLPDVDDPIFGANTGEKFAHLRERIAEGADVAAAGVAMSEMLGVYAIVGAVGAVSEGAGELLALQRRQIRDYRRDNLAAIKNTKSATEAAVQMARANRHIFSKGMKQRLNIARKTVRGVVLPFTDSLEVLTSMGKKHR